MAMERELIREGVDREVMRKLLIAWGLRSTGPPPKKRFDVVPEPPSDKKGLDNQN